MPVIKWFNKLISGYDIFISYSRRDSLDYAYATALYFMSKGYECYIDQLSNINPGQKLPANIKNAVKRSTAFVLIGSEGAQGSAAIKEEVCLFLEHNKNKPLIPVTINHAINEEAVWYPDIAGLALIDDNPDNLNVGKPAQDVLDRIENALKFTRKARRLRGTAIGILIAVTAITGMMSLYALGKTKEAQRAEQKTFSAEMRRSVAESREKKAVEKANAVNAKLELTEVSLQSAQSTLHTARQNLARSAEQLSETKDQVTLAQKQAAQENRVTTARSLANDAASVAGFAPQQAILLATNAVKTTQQDGYIDPYAESVFRKVLAQTGGFAMQGHRDGIITADFNNEETMAATGSHDGTCRIWDIKDPSGIRCTQVLNHRGNSSVHCSVNKVAFSPDSKTVLTFSNLPGSGSHVLLWDLTDNIKYPAPRKFIDSAKAMAVSTDGSAIALGMQDGRIYIYDFNDPDPLKPLYVLQSKLREQVSALKFCVDNQVLIAGTKKGNISIWEVHPSSISEKVIYTGFADINNKREFADIQAIDITNDRKWFLTASISRELEEDQFAIHLWKLDVPIHKPIFLCYGEEAFFSNNRAFVLPREFNETIKTWDLLQKDIPGSMQELKGYKNGIYAAGLPYPNTWFLTAGHDNNIYSWNMEGNSIKKLPIEMRGHTETINVIKPSRSGKWMISGSFDNSAKLWRLDNTSVYEQLVLSPALNYAATSLNDQLEIWDIENILSPRCLKKLPLSVPYTASQNNKASFSPDGSWLIYNSGSNQEKVILTLVNTRTLAGVLDIKIRKGSQQAFLFSPNSRYLLANEGNDQVLYDLSPGSTFIKKQKIATSDYSFDHYTFSPDSKWLATAVTENADDLAFSGRIWSLSVPDDTLRYYNIYEHHKRVGKMVFSPDSKWLLTYEEWQSFTLFQHEKALLLFKLSPTNIVERKITLTDNVNDVEHISFSASGKWLLTSVMNNSTYANYTNLWNMENIEQDLLPIELKGFANGVSFAKFSPDEKYLLFSTFNEKDTWLYYLNDPAIPHCSLNGPEYDYDDEREVVFSPDNTMLAIANGYAQSPYLWHLSPKLSSTEGLQLKRVNSNIKKLAFTDDSRSLLALGSNVATLSTVDTFSSELNRYDLTMDPRSAIPRQIFLSSEKIEDFSFSRDKKYIITSVNSLKVWNLSIDKLLINAGPLIGRNLTADEWTNTDLGSYEKTFEKYPVHFSVFERLLQKINKFNDAGDRRSAIGLLKKLNKWALETKDAEICHAVARAAVLMKEPTLAGETLQAAIELDPLNGYYKDTRAIFFVLKGQYQPAIEDFQSFISWTMGNRKYNLMTRRRNGWISLLKENKNPFKDETIISNK